jgi:predicted esterase
MTYSSGNNDIGVLDHPSGSQDSSIESMTRSSESSDSISTIQSNNASNHTSSFPRTSADRQRTHATSEPPLSNSDRDTDHNVPRRPTQHGSHKAHHTPGVQDDVLSSNSSEIDSRSLLSRHELTKLENIQNLQRSIHPTTGPSISPNDDSFKTWLSTYVLEEFPAHKERITSRVILVLHDYSGNQNTLKVFAEEHLKEPDTSYILLRGTRSVVDSPRRYHWADSDYFLNRSFLEATWTIGQFILEGLVKKHNISPRNIVLFGHGQGGMVALSVAASWNTTELGGVITVGGPLPEHFTLPSKADISTPVLVLGGELGSINPIAERRIRDFFMYVETNLAPNIKDILPPSRDKISISMLKEFLAHRLWQREWIQPSIMALGRLVENISL